MLNLFNVSKKWSSQGHGPSDHSHAGHDHGDHDDHDHGSDVHNIDVHHRHESEDTGDIGQIALDIGDTDDAIIVLAPIAGVSMEGIDISIAKNILTISGVRRRPEITKEFHKSLVEECFWGPFSRSIVLPENLALDRIRATMHDNLLEIHLPRIRFPSRAIKIDRLTH